MGLHGGLLLSFLWLKQFNSCSDFTREGISPFPCDGKSFLLKTSNVILPLTLLSHQSSGLCSAGDTAVDSKKALGSITPWSCLHFENCVWTPKIKTLLSTLPSTCISEKQASQRLLVREHSWLSGKFQELQLAQRKLKLKDDLSDLPHAALCQLAIIWFIFWEVSRTSPGRKALKMKIKSQGHQYQHQIWAAI